MPIIAAAYIFAWDKTRSIVDEFIAGRGAADVVKRDFKLYDFNEDGELNVEEFACVRGAMSFA